MLVHSPFQGIEGDVLQSSSAGLRQGHVQGQAYDGAAGPAAEQAGRSDNAPAGIGEEATVRYARKVD